MSGIHDARRPLAGFCLDIDGDSWHRDDHRCEHCGFGIDDAGDGRGYYDEPLVTAVAAAADSLEWRTDCGVTEPVEEDYALGDWEPCVHCDDDTCVARVCLPATLTPTRAK